MDIDGQNKSQGTTNPHSLSKENVDGYISGLGSWLMGNSLKDTTYITSTMIKITTQYLIWSYSQEVSTKSIMDFKETLLSVCGIWERYDQKLQNGISQPKGESGIEQTMQILQRHFMKKGMNITALNAIKPLCPISILKLNSAILPALTDSNVRMKPNSKSSPVLGAVPLLDGTDEKKDVLLNAQVVSLISVENPRKEEVYNFEVRGTHTYCLGESQIIVHNCDTISMLSVLKPWKPSEAPKVSKDTSGIWTDEVIYEEDNGYLDNYIV
jgi:hypothetical protein